MTNIDLDTVERITSAVSTAQGIPVTDFQRNIPDCVDIEFGDMTAAQFVSIRSTLEALVAGNPGGRVYASVRISVEV